MQAQATNSGAGNAPQSLLQNPKVQIGVVVAGALALIVVIWMVFFPPSGPAPASPAAGYPGTPPATVGGGPSGAAEGGAPAAAGYPGAKPAAPAPSAISAPTAPAGPGGAAAPAAAPGDKSKDGGKPAPPGVKTRSNPFAENTDLKKSLDSIPPPIPLQEPVYVAPQLDIYKELYKGKVDVKVTSGEDQNDGPPIPAMRVAGVIFGSSAGPTATMQIGDQFIQVTPGKMIPEGNPVFRVERIEQEKVVLSRRWEMGSKHGVQRIEVTLAGSAARSGGGGFSGAGGGGGYPGGMLNRPKGGAPGSTN